MATNRRRQTRDKKHRPPASSDNKSIGRVGFPRAATLTIFGIIIATLVLLLGSQLLALRNLETRAAALEDNLVIIRERNDRLQKQKEEANSTSWLEQRLLSLNFLRKGDWEYVPVSENTPPAVRQVFIPERYQARAPKWQQWWNWFTHNRADLTMQP